MRAAAIPDQQPDDDPKVPLLRQDLELLEGWPSHTGAPTWLLFDSLRNKYFRISNTMFQFLTFWPKEKFSEIISSASHALQRPVDVSELGEFVKFLFTNQLTSKPADGGVEHYVESEKRGQRSFLAKIIHSYLFFKIPLVRPQRFLDVTWPAVRPLFSSMAALLFAILGLIAIYLVSRQWDAFNSQFVSFLSVEGFLMFGASLVFVKILHELGHAYMAQKYKLQVPVIGLAFLVLMPILYTDTSNAWRLKSRRQRLMIDAAGIMTELCLATIATLFWIFLPDGPMRSVAFSTATVGWLSSVFINLNPFMRFDGYYILSDVLGFENLQERGFAIARWRMREVFFGLGLPPPERIKLSMRRIVTLHAWGTWIYRFFLFLGIAVLVYTFFIKTVGIFLFVVEILWFILLPIYREMKVWWSMRNQLVQSRRTLATFGIWAALLLAFFLPLSGTIRFPATLHASEEVQIFPPVSARLSKLDVVQGQRVSGGEMIAQLESESLSLSIEKSRNTIKLLETRVDRSGSDAFERNNKQVLLAQLQSERNILAGLMNQHKEMTITAPFSGTVVDLDRTLGIGDMVAQERLLFAIIGPQQLTVSGLINEESVPRVNIRGAGIFIPENLQLPKLDVTLTMLNKVPISIFSFPELSEPFGGTVPVKPGTDANPVPHGSFYRANLAITDSQIEHAGQTQRGTVHLEATRVSLAKKVFDRVGSVLIRESGF